VIFYLFLISKITGTCFKNIPKAVQGWSKVFRAHRTFGDFV